MNKKLVIDKTASITPGVELGSLKLRTHLKDYYELVKSFSWVDSEQKYQNASVRLYGDFHVGYELKDTLVAVFHVLNGKLIKIIAKKNYMGSYEGITVGMKISEAKKKVQGFYFDEGEELYFIRGENGIAFEGDAYYNYIYSIIVYIEELDLYTHDFSKWEELERGNW